MKRYIHVLAVMCFASIGSCLAEFDLYERPADYSVVNDIKKKSDLTQADVDKLKLVWLGRLQEVAAVGVGGYSAYKAGTGAYQLLDKLGEYAPAENNKFLWALAGAAGVSFGAYKVLYTRMERGILGQVKAYVNMCENLDVFKSYYQTESQLAYLGTSAGNSAWATSNIARLKGIDNLLAQGAFALQLLDQLENAEEVQGLRARVSEIIRRLNNNYNIIAYYANREFEARKKDMSTRMGGAQELARLKLAQEQASALKVGKISLAVTALSNFLQRSMESTVYLYENKEKIVGGVLIGAGAVYAGLSYLQYKLFGN